MSRSARFGFTIHVSTSGPEGDAKVSVEVPLAAFGLPGMTLRSSRNRAPNIEGTRWPEELAWTIKDRLRGTGARKGRILAIWQRDQIVAACCWHLHETGPLVVFDLGCRTDVGKAVADKARTALLLCLRDIADTLGRSSDELRWTNSPLDHMPDSAERKRAKGAVRARARDLKFGPLRPRPKWVRNAWVAVRRF